MDEVFVLMEYCIYCSGVFGWVDEWMDEVFVLMEYCIYCSVVFVWVDDGMSICIDGVSYTGPEINTRPRAKCG